MVNFQVENERAEMTQEVMGDMLDDAMAEDGDSDEEEKIVGAVLDEALSTLLTPTETFILSQERYEKSK